MNEEVKNRALKFIPLLAVVLSLFLVVQTLNALRDYGSGDLPKNVITVEGSGEVFAPPDIAEFNFSVNSEGKDIKEAQSKVTTKIDAAVKSLKDAGVLEKDIKTTDYNAYPKYEYSQSVCPAVSSISGAPVYCPPGKQVLVGYEVNQTISVKVRKVDDAGKLLELVANAGVTNVSGLSFTIDDEEKLQRQARQMAIDEAKEKAKVLAKDLGVRLVRIVSFNESGNYPTPIYFGREAAMGMGGDAQVKAPSVPTGENKITSNVTITYEIR
ncbi:MAG TPA: SIMPL domain-containing protein [Candidatus Paceibacterota bacterium]